LLKLSDKRQTGHLRNLARTDLYFLIRYLLKRPDIEHPWLFERCREIEAEPNEYMDLWSREHYKSTIITFGKSIQDILASHGDGALWDREVTFGLFSFNAGTAHKFVAQIKNELESNPDLKRLFPDILYDNPSREAESWSVQGGLIVKRKGNPKEATFSGHGLVDSMPTGSHFYGRLYDDVITERFARSPEMIRKVTDSWELSLSLGARGGFSRYIGTRYHYNDSYRTIMQRGAAKPRVYPATQDGTVEGEPVLLTSEELAKKRREMGPYNFGCQMMQDPKADETQGFKRDWLNFWDAKIYAGMNIYMLVDPANEKKRHSDYTAIAVVGLGKDGNKYWIDGVRDRLNIKERCDAVMELHRRYKPIKVGYEKYGIQTDIDYIKREQQLENYRFEIIPLGGSMAKNDRIKRMVPDLAAGTWYWPNSISKETYDGRLIDVVEQTLTEEYDPFPVPLHDDMIDCMSRIYDQDLATVWPRSTEVVRYATRPARQKRSGWTR
jgi:phage terminase large subunit-like protein